MRVAGKTIWGISSKILVVAAALAALSLPAAAQARKGSGIDSTKSPEEAAKLKQRDEEARAAKAAMQNIPDSKEKYDPWKITR
ncbi:MAG: hypothetical protein K2X34_06575 [Hyphomonadaceae bacterium]|nr:hypothetical protein [Hyphomonadaceae bacterium]